MFLFKWAWFLGSTPQFLGVFVPIKKFNGFVLWGTGCLSILTLMLDTKVTPLMLWESLCCLSSKPDLRILSRTFAVQLSRRDTETPAHHYPTKGFSCGIHLRNNKPNSPFWLYVFIWPTWNVLNSWVGSMLVPLKHGWPSWTYRALTRSLPGFITTSGIANNPRHVETPTQHIACLVPSPSFL